MEYQEGQILKLTEDVGKPDKKGFLKKGTKVEFVKLLHSDIEPDKAMVAVKYGDRTIVVPELDVKVPSWFKRKRIEWEFNKKMMEGNPELRKYHPIKVVSWYWKCYYYFKKEEVNAYKIASIGMGILFLLTLIAAGVKIYG